MHVSPTLVRDLAGGASRPVRAQRYSLAASRKHELVLASDFGKQVKEVRVLSPTSHTYSFRSWLTLLVAPGTARWIEYERYCWDVAAVVAGT